MKNNLGEILGTIAFVFMLIALAAFIGCLFFLLENNHKMADAINHNADLLQKLVDKPVMKISCGDPDHLKVKE